MRLGGDIGADRYDQVGLDQDALAGADKRLRAAEQRKGLGHLPANQLRRIIGTSQQCDCGFRLGHQLCTWAQMTA